jgi:hypothetical protein
LPQRIETVRAHEAIQLISWIAALALAACAPPAASTPAVVEGTSGKGCVILCGVHPEAPENWRRGMAFTTPASVANAYAGALIDAVL